MTTPLAFGRHVAAPGDTVKGNVKVVELGLFGGSTCASPMTAASASATVNIVVASFMENLLLLRMCQLRMRCYRWQGRENAYCSLPVEGQINQLKMIKHQMYSRAGLELLRPCLAVQHTALAGPIP
jgi:hypothetical protein